MNKSLDVSNFQFGPKAKRKSNVETNYCAIMGYMTIFDVKIRKIGSPILTTSTFSKYYENGTKDRKSLGKKTVTVFLNRKE